MSSRETNITYNFFYSILVVLQFPPCTQGCSGTPRELPTTHNGHSHLCSLHQLLRSCQWSQHESILLLTTFRLQLLGNLHADFEGPELPLDGGWRKEVHLPFVVLLYENFNNWNYNSINMNKLYWLLKLLIVF